MSATHSTTPFIRLSGLAAILAALVGLLYSISFVALQNNLLSALCLMLGGLFSITALTALFEELRRVDAGAAMFGLLLAAAGALGAAIHGGYDLANALNPPLENTPALADLPSAIDPRGLLTFGVAGLALLVAVLLMQQDAGYSRGFIILTFVLALLLIVVYIGRLILLAPTNPLLLAAAIATGFVVNPLWYLLLGMRLRRQA
jgi:hypothetical protein